MKGFERCFKVEDQGTWHRENLHAAILGLLFQDTYDDKIDLTLFEDAIHQIAKLSTSDTVEVKGLTQADIESTLFSSPPICITYNNRRSKVVENVSQ